ncbi:MAG: UTP-glucose-1-phosphate uridylyltransferase [Vezdaea aestivalis]|nr:MAG: UTP-glucose-1-phosphate uridylyltransferase [Vezdaea aestivalis]
MAALAAKALPSHLRPSGLGSKEEDPGFARKHHGKTQSHVAFENTSTSVAASQMRNALNVLADTVEDPTEKKLFETEMDNFFALFRRYLNDKAKGNQLDWDRIAPPQKEQVVDYDTLSNSESVEFLNKLAVIKLNGGLGTSMGCVGPKSVIEVRDGMSFLDLSVRQIEYLNRLYKVNVPFVLMNSFNTDEDTQNIIKKYEGHNIDIMTFNQSRYPRVLKDSLLPAPKNNKSQISDWYPPGHGDVFESLYNSGILDKLLARGVEIVFLSNADNLGAVVDLRILQHMVESDAEYIMELTDKTKADVKGGTIIDYEGSVRLLEIAQVPKEHTNEFKSIKKFKYFNTNNIWLNLKAIKRVVENSELEMEIIPNNKTIPADKKGESDLSIVQLETAVGAAIRHFKNAHGVNVPRRRFLPVKTCSDLMLVKSDLYSLKHGQLSIDPSRFGPAPLIKLGSDFKKVSDFQKRISSIPKMLELDHLTITGAVNLGRGVQLKGTVIIVATEGSTIDVPPGSILENVVVQGSLPKPPRPKIVPLLPRAAAMSTIAAFKIPTVNNEPNKHYAKDSPERAKLAAAVKVLKQNTPSKVPLVIGGKEVTNSDILKQYNPASHATPVAEYSNASKDDVQQAIESALAAKPAWESLPFADRAAIFLKAADLVAGKYRYEIMAATMIGQGKNAWQAEIDAAAELCDFLRFNVKYAEDLYAQQPVHNSPGVWNRVEYRPLDGFVYAITPFNFTAIAGNLPCAPALLGNVVVWKPSPSAILSNHVLYNILLEAGLPASVIQFVPGDAIQTTQQVFSHPRLSALHYTGSTAVFRNLYGQLGAGVAEGRYRDYPRIVGETGGKNFHLVHPSAALDNAVLHTVRGAFEYQGQKCSAASRAYVPKSIWPAFRERLAVETDKLAMGDPEDAANFVGPVIHEASFKKLAKAIDDGKADPSLELVAGGEHDRQTGWFVRPTVFSTTDPTHKLLSEELFGPILAVLVYDDSKPGYWAEIAKTIDQTSSYALTGAVFATDRQAVREAEDALRSAAGNFYVNCKCTGAVVGQQPFGGGRASGTNDKAGSMNLLSRFVSMRALKEEFVNVDKVAYPSNEV